MGLEDRVDTGAHSSGPSFLSKVALTFLVGAASLVISSCGGSAPTPTVTPTPTPTATATQVPTPTPKPLDALFDYLGGTLQPAYLPPPGITARQSGVSSSTYGEELLLQDLEWQVGEVTLRATVTTNVLGRLYELNVAILPPPQFAFSEQNAAGTLEAFFLPSAAAAHCYDAGSSMRVCEQFSPATSGTELNKGIVIASLPNGQKAMFACAYPIDNTKRFTQDSCIPSR